MGQEGSRVKGFRQRGGWRSQGSKHGPTFRRLARNRSELGSELEREGTWGIEEASVWARLL